MGSKHDKKRYFIVKYQINKDGKWDELIELSKKKVGPGKIKESGIVLLRVLRDKVFSALGTITFNFIWHGH